ncbi:MAG: hypothetical protein AAGH81_01060 [Bacteroidota bacterium]
MNATQKSLFNLIEIFRGKRIPSVSTIITKDHCDKKHHHDFYCDAEKPFVTNY